MSKAEVIEARPNKGIRSWARSLVKDRKAASYPDEVYVLLDDGILGVSYGKDAICVFTSEELAEEYGRETGVTKWAYAIGKYQWGELAKEFEDASNAIVDNKLCLKDRARKKATFPLAKA